MTSGSYPDSPSFAPLRFHTAPAVPRHFVAIAAVLAGLSAGSIRALGAPAASPPSSAGGDLQAEERAEPRPSGLSGQVLDLLHGTAIPGVKVTLVETGARTHSDRSGRFSFPKV
jgi:hypothetical protein